MGYYAVHHHAANGLRIAAVVLFFLVLVAIATGIILLVRQGSVRRHPATPAASAAVTILNERFARGEIAEEEYRRRLEVLRQGGSAP